jgi:D-glycero-alpha-D-manno-heptose-7-phosphate kinase
MLITSRTPLRVSFFGGGTDYPEYYSRYPGAVVGMAINQYVYVSALRLSNFIDYKYRVSYSRVERVESADRLEHPVVRSILTHYAVSDALDINIIADLPSSSGLGSSSAFTVGLLNLVCALQDKPMTRIDLALAAIHVERELLKERVGVQDQLHAAFGGINRFDFVNGRIRIAPIQMHSDSQAQLLSSLVLVYTGVTRYASKVLEEQIKATNEQKVDRELSHLLNLANQSVAILEGTDPDVVIRDFGAIMHDGWMTKRKLAASVSSGVIDALYERALTAGAIGGKLCGAGGGGFLLMVVPPSARPRFDEALKDCSVIQVMMDMHGSTIITS